MPAYYGRARRDYEPDVVNVSPVFGARTFSWEPGPAEGGTVTAKWPSIMKRVWLSGQLLKRAALCRSLCSARTSRIGAGNAQGAVRSGSTAPLAVIHVQGVGRTIPSRSLISD